MFEKAKGSIHLHKLHAYVFVNMQYEYELNDERCHKASHANYLCESSNSTTCSPTGNELGMQGM